MAMLAKPQTFEALLALWETPKALSDDLGLPYVSAQMMKRRKSISATNWPAFVEAARIKGIELTADDFMQMRIAREAEGRERAA